MVLHVFFSTVNYTMLFLMYICSFWKCRFVCYFKRFVHLKIRGFKAFWIMFRVCNGVLRNKLDFTKGIVSTRGIGKQTISSFCSMYHLGYIVGPHIYLLHNVNNISFFRSLLIYPRAWLIFFHCYLNYNLFGGKVTFFAVTFSNGKI